MTARQRLALLVLLSTHAFAPTFAQTLARPGWAGSGLAAESWWRNAVFYRIDVRAFQDSAGDGLGDLRGVADRMDYLQSLGVDALLFDPPLDPNAEGFDEVIHAATPRHLRVLVALEDGGSPGEQTLIAQARLWLTRGAAGLFLHSQYSAEGAAPRLHRLRALADSFPGSRILLTETGTNPAPGTLQTINSDTPPHTRPAAPKLSAGAELNSVPLELTNASATTLRAALNGVNESPASGTIFLTEQIDPATTQAQPSPDAIEGRRRAFALILLASRGAAALRFGQEIGLPPTRPSAHLDRLMQWTASNGAAAVKKAPVVEVKKDPNDGYGTFHPYVPPPPRNLLPPPPRLPVAEPGGAPPPVDQTTLPGFTTGKLPLPPPTTAATFNVAREDTDPGSLLNLYRRLIVLHHDHPTLRDGGESVLDLDTLNAVGWIRLPPHSPAGGLNAAPIVVICNLSAAPLRLSLDAELARRHLRTGTLRSLLSNGGYQTTDAITLPPFGVYLGELAR